MQALISGQALDGGDIRAFVLNGKRQARKDAVSVDQNSASAARALVAALFRAGQVQVFPQCVEQRNPGLNAQGVSRRRLCVTLSH